MCCYSIPTISSFVSLYVTDEKLIAGVALTNDVRPLAKVSNKRRYCRKGFSSHARQCYSALKKCFPSVFLLSMNSMYFLGYMSGTTTLKQTRVPKPLKIRGERIKYPEFSKMRKIQISAGERFR